MSQERQKKKKKKNPVPETKIFFCIFDQVDILLKSILCKSAKKH